MKIEVKPKDGLIVPHPETGLPMRYCSIERTPAVIRLIKSGDLVIVDPPKPKKKAVKKESK